MISALFIVVVVVVDRGKGLQRVSSSDEATAGCNSWSSGWDGPAGHISHGGGGGVE